MSMEEANTLRIFERNIVGNIYGPTQEGMLENKNKQKKIQDILQGEGNLKFIKSLDLCLVGSSLDSCGTSCHQTPK